MPGATLTYDVRPGTASDEPPLFLIGSPMGAAGFGTLAGHFPDRTIITYDPRGAGAQHEGRPDDASRRPTSTPTTCIGSSRRSGGPVDLFASSGGAVNALALVAKHPEDVRTLVAHEPPLASVLPDREQRQGGGAAPIQRLLPARRVRRGDGALHRHHQPPRPVPDDFAQQPAPDPAMFGMPTEDDGSRTDVMLGAEHHPARRTTSPTSTRCGRASTRIVMAAGAESEGEMANRGGHAVAERLGSEPVIFPSDHGGFLGGEYG